MTLKELRKSKGYTQSEAAKQLSVSLRTYKRLEQRENCRKEYLDKLSISHKKPNVRNRLKRQNILIIGAGFVGLSTGFLLNKICNITFYDKNNKVLDNIKNNFSPIDNFQFIDAFRTKPNFLITKKIENIVNYNVVIISIPTNLNPQNNQLDTSDIEELLKIINCFKSKPIVIIRSTLPVGACNKFTTLYRGTIVYVPEFLRELSAIDDIFHPSRLIFGVKTLNEKAKTLAQYFVKSISYCSKTFFMSYEEAESVKLFSNTYLAMRVAFFNELDSFATIKNMDVKTIINGICADERIGDYYNQPSFGYGGYCLPKDSTELKSLLYEENIGTLIPSISKSNNERFKFITQDIIRRIEAMNITQKIVIIDQPSKHLNEPKSINLKIFNELINQGKNVELLYVPVNEKVLADAGLIVTNTRFPGIEKYIDKIYTKNLKI